MNLKKEELTHIGAYHEGMPWNAVEQVIMNRRSVRSFKQGPLPDSMIRRNVSLSDMTIKMQIYFNAVTIVLNHAIGL
jgi:hypothetical protein